MMGGCKVHVSVREYTCSIWKNRRSNDWNSSLGQLIMKRLWSIVERDRERSSEG